MSTAKWWPFCLDAMFQQDQYSPIVGVQRADKMDEQGRLYFNKKKLFLQKIRL